VAAVVVLVTRRRGASMATLVPTGLIFLNAISVMVTVSGPGNPVMWPIVGSAVLITVALMIDLTTAGAPQTCHPHR
jgi:hypothetical protein